MIYYGYMERSRSLRTWTEERDPVTGNIRLISEPVADLDSAVVLSIPSVQSNEDLLRITVTDDGRTRIYLEPLSSPTAGGAEILAELMYPDASINVDLVPNKPKIRFDHRPDLPDTSPISETD